MIQVVWKFRIKEGKRKGFEQYYRSRGKWAALFEKSKAYHGTVLLRDTEDPDRYLLYDQWEDIDSFRRFKQDHMKEYEKLDQKCHEFTEEETCLGFFDER